MIDFGIGIQVAFVINPDRIEPFGQIHREWRSNMGQIFYFEDNAW
jgi:hypothetical protein